MNALEKQILDKVRQLDTPQQERVLEFLSTITAPAFDWDKWLLNVESFQSQLKAKYGERHYFGVQDLLDELREETSWPQ